MADIEDAFLSLGLSEEQENNIRAIVENCTKKANHAFEQSKTLKAMFNDIRDNLDEIKKS